MLCPYAEIGYEIMPAPNRYRRLFNGFSDTGFEAGPGMRLLFSEGMNGFQDARDTALEMQKSDWPEKADRAIGMEPHFNMCDEILIWRSE